MGSSSPPPLVINWANDRSSPQISPCTAHSPAGLSISLPTSHKLWYFGLGYLTGSSTGVLQWLLWFSTNDSLFSTGEECPASGACRLVISLSWPQQTHSPPCRNHYDIFLADWSDAGLCSGIFPHSSHLYRLTFSLFFQCH